MIRKSVLILLLSSASYASGLNGISNQSSLQSGSQFYVSSGTIAGQSLFATTSGNVGIGTTTTSAKLVVVGATNQLATVIGDAGLGTLYAGLSVQGSLTSANYSMLGNGANLYINRPTGGDIIFRENNSGTGGVIFQNGTGNVGIGIVSPANKLDVYNLTGETASRVVVGDANSPGYVTAQSGRQWGFIADAQGSGAIGVASGLVIRDMSAGLNRMAIDTAGNVGINTVSPANKLDVSGAMAIGTYAGVNTAPSNGLIVSGSVGIGTTTAVSKLTVQDPSNAKLRGTDGSNFVEFATAGGLNYFESHGHDLQVYTGSGSDIETARFTMDQKVGIGTASPSTKLHLSSGTFTIDGNVSPAITIKGSGAPSDSQALCLLNGQLGHCTTVVGATGGCTCSVP